MAVAIAALYNTERAREDGCSTADSVTRFKVYEDYLDSKVTPMDAYALKNRELARKLVEPGHKGTVLSREEFEEKKAAAQAPEAVKSNTFYSRSQPMTLASAGKELKDNFLKALAEREEANRSGKMTTKSKTAESPEIICEEEVQKYLGTSITDAFVTVTGSPVSRKSAQRLTDLEAIASFIVKLRTKLNCKKAPMDVLIPAADKVVPDMIPENPDECTCKTMAICISNGQHEVHSQQLGYIIFENLQRVHGARKQTQKLTKKNKQVDDTLKRIRVVLDLPELPQDTMTHVESAAPSTTAESGVSGDEDISTTPVTEPRPLSITDEPGVDSHVYSHGVQRRGNTERGMAGRNLEYRNTVLEESVIFIRDHNTLGQEVSGYIDYAHRLKTQDFEPYFSGKKRLMPGRSDLCYYNWKTQVSTSNSSPNFEVIYDDPNGLLFKNKRDKKILNVDPLVG
ncbi:protein C4orf22-like protein, partial [Nibea albiflora]